MDDYHIRDLKDQIEMARHYGQRVSVNCDDGKLLFGYVADTQQEEFSIRDSTKSYFIRYLDVIVFDNMDADR